MGSIAPIAGGGALALLEPNLSLADDFRDMIDEYRSVNEEFDGANAYLTDDVERYVKLARDLSTHDGLLPGMVPQTSYWLVMDGNTIVAASWLRHRLTPSLSIEGGHIGYTVRPKFRRQGYGTRLCALTLQCAKEIGITRALITCDLTNIASARIINKNGGKMAGEGTSPRTGRSVSRYWVELD